MAKMSPAQAAAYALDFGVSREDLKPAAQAEYDHQLAERRAQSSRQAVPGPEARAEMLKQANREYARAFEAERDSLGLMPCSTWGFLLSWVGSPLLSVLAYGAVLQLLWPGRLDLRALAGGAVGATLAGVVTGLSRLAGRR